MLKRTILVLPLLFALTARADERADAIVARGIEYAGGWKAWDSLRSVQFRKTTTRYRPDGTVEYQRVQLHRYQLKPSLRARIDWEEEGKKIVMINNGHEAWKAVEGTIATSQQETNSARNSTFGSHYVFGMPFKLLDPGAVRTYAGSETLADGTVVEKVRVTYPPGVGDAGGYHTWTYYFDAKSGRLCANHLNYGPDQYDYTEYREDVAAGPLRVAKIRLGYNADAKGKVGERFSEIVYDEFRFNADYPASLFAK